MTTSRRFNDQSYIDEYLNTGAFPKIHDQVAYLIKKHASEPEAAIDLGSNIGLLSLRAVELGRSFCVGIEGGPDYFRAVRESKVKYENFFITRETFPRLVEVLKTYKPTLVIARRVLSEIGIKDPKVVTEMAGLFKEHGVKKFILQGRVPVASPTVALYNSETEQKAIDPHFALKDIYNSAYYSEVR